ncbi:tetratricopeptide repeat protein [Paenibacillus ginsengihumi]|uniref:tetratricopeptide repeat protein n=1 Tax=Paenibacillus ginsengihumi TaxID=431596 RepID=UPI000379BB49|nr:tetratricopeptide repeat protein [Paenibacillus ginsengihumi]
MVLEDAEDEISGYYFGDDVRQRLLDYALLPALEADGIDEHTLVRTLYNLALEALDNGDVERSIHYDTIAAEKGYPPSMNNLAETYSSIEGYRDDDKAFYWYQKGAEAGHPYAMNGLGMCYQHGIGTVPDADKAMYWLGVAADNENALAHNNLAAIYYDGELVPQNIGEALVHFEEGERLGSPHYGWLGYLHDSLGNLEKALHYFRLDYEEGSDVGAYNLGIFHREGLGTAKDVGAAIAYFQEAWERGYPQAHIELASIYVNEPGFANEALAKKHAAKARQARLDLPDGLAGLL